VLQNCPWKERKTCDLKLNESAPKLGPSGTEGAVTRASRFLFTSCVLAPLSASSFAFGTEIVEGQPRMVEIRGTKIRHEGIDAPETDQLCLDNRGARWACGIEARDQLIARTGKLPWACVLSERDRYGRSLWTCKVDGEM
jgi:endonuclease YncB( thermonuclease family)